MSFAGISYPAVLVAAIAAWLFGALWYAALAKPWMTASGWSGREEMLAAAGGKVSPLPFVISFVAELVMAYFLAGLIAHLGPVTVTNGLVTGFFIWLAFIATTIAVNHRYMMKPWSLTLIDAGHWLGVLLVLGAVIGIFG
jgi:hypothetical protein